MKMLWHICQSKIRKWLVEIPSVPDAKHSIWTSFFLRYQSLTLQLATHLSMVFLSVFRMILLILD